MPNIYFYQYNPRISFLKIFVIFSLNNFTMNYFFLLYVITKFKHIETRKKDNSTNKATTRLKKGLKNQVNIS